MKPALKLVTAVIMVMIAAVPVCADRTHPKGITLDGTIGSAGKLELPGPDYEIKAEYGKQAGANLFHSFQQFNIYQGESATFTGADSVQNIISRVTGGNASWIDGRIAAAISGADLYFLNPAGVMFGPNASLDLPGSFHVSTADYLRLGKTERFYSTPRADELISVASPTAFGFLDANVGGIAYEGRGEITESEWERSQTGLHVKEGKSLSFIGGSIDITNGTYYKIQKTDENGSPIFEKDENGDSVMETVHPGDIKAPGGQISIAAATSAGEVVLTESGLDITSPEKGNISLSGKSLTDVSGTESGSIFIQGGQFFADDSAIQSRTLGDKDGGILAIRADDVFFANGANISCDTEGTGTGTDVEILAGRSVRFSGENSNAEPSRIKLRSGNENPNAGNGGSLLIDAENISFTDGAYIDLFTYGTGRTGDITIKGDSVSFAGETSRGWISAIGLSAAGEDDDAGDAGTLLMDAKDISFTDGAYIDSFAYGKGRGGDLILKADSISFAGESAEGKVSAIGLGAACKEAGAGDAGTLLIDAENISFTDGAYIDLFTQGRGRGGSLTFKADSISFAGESDTGEVSHIDMTTAYEGEGAGDAGTLLMDAENIAFTDGASVNAATSGRGRGGDVSLKADSVSFAGESSKAMGSMIISITVYKGEGAGDAGDLLIEAGNISFSDGAFLISDTSGKGEAGNIKLMAQEKIRLSNRGKGWGETFGTVSGGARSTSTGGGGGEILLEAGDIQLADGAEITAETSGAGDAGNIILRADRTIDISGRDTRGNVSRISSGSKKITDAGNGGDIMISAQTLSLSDGGEISTSAEGNGKAGEIRLNVKEFRMNQEASVSSESGFVNSYAFDSLSERDSRILIAGDVINVEDTGGGKSESYIWTGEATRLTPVYTVANISELNELNERYAVSQGDIAEVVQTDGKSARYIYAYGTDELWKWLRFSNAAAVSVPDMAAIDFNDTWIHDKSDLPPYSPGDMIRVENTGSGKPGIFIYSAIQQYSDGPFLVQAVRMRRFETADTQGLADISESFSLKNGDVATVADAGNGSASEFIFCDGEWIAFNNFHTVANIAEADALIIVHAGSTVNVADAGKGKSETFIYSGRNWITLNDVQAVPDMAARENFAAQTGDVVKVLDAGAGKPETFLYADGGWIKFAGGNAGTVAVNADRIIMENDSTITTSTRGHGSAGDIILTAENLEFGTGASVSSESGSPYFGGDAGSLAVNAADSVKLSGGASLTTEANGAGGGKISVNAGNEMYLLESGITSSVKEGAGKGGDVTAASKFVILNHSAVAANAEEGDGGAIFIRTENFLKSSDSSVTATSKRGNDGTVKIEAPDTDISSSLTVMPENFLDAARWMQTPCGERTSDSVSRFVIKGRDGVMNPPDDFQAGSPDDFSEYSGDECESCK